MCISMICPDRGNHFEMMFLHAVDDSPPNHSLRCFIGTVRFGRDNARKVFNILFGNFVITLSRRCLLG